MGRLAATFSHIPTGPTAADKCAPASLTLPEAAAYLRVSRRQVQRFVADGELAPRRVRRRVFFELADLVAWKVKQYEAAVAEAEQRRVQRSASRGVLAWRF